MKILFIAGFGPITADIEESRRLYEGALGINFKREEGDYRHTEELTGANTFAVWPLVQAAESCFGTNTWPEDVVRPRGWVEFDVDDVDGAVGPSRDTTHQPGRPSGRRHDDAVDA